MLHKPSISLLVSFLLWPLLLQAQDPFALGVRTTPHLPPAEEQKGFKLPPGFEIQLVAAEPEIQKPLNMAFDERGRLWVTDTIEYPYAAPLDKPGRDTIKVIEFDYTTGKATKITTFADGLNIPIGVLPYGDGCIAHSIPNIWFFHDTDGDGKCDKREILYGPFDHSRDTHGMENAFRRGFDGWIYACHGFNNNSKVQGKDGNVVEMSSGNTFRFKPDGSRIEHFSHGQVNPFGMCIDPLFNIFTADCHSKPITQILRGAYYPSFGKPHDGLGYVPSMMEHSHGSTAICGLVYVDGENFPPEYRGNLLSGNVMTSRINRNSLIYHGSTIQCKEEPDFLSTTDPWFRPVDLQIGPDGAMYIADFYNRIIGHYEVPLPHPGRDRTSGRIWRVVYKGDNKDTKPAVKQKDLSKASVEELIAEFEHPVLGQRLLAEDELVNRVGKDVLPRVVSKCENPKNSQQAIHLLWTAGRLDSKQPNRLLSDNKAVIASAFNDDVFQVHILKIIANFKAFESLTPDGPLGTFDELIRNKHPASAFVKRAAAEVLAQNTKREQAVVNVEYLLNMRKQVPSDDNHLNYIVRMAIRNNLMQLDNLDFVVKLQPEEKVELAKMALAVQSPTAAKFLVTYLETSQEPKDQLLPYLTHAARYVEGDGVAKLNKIVQQRWKEDLDLQLQALLAIQQGLAQRGQSAESLMAWGEEIGKQVLASAATNDLMWENHAIAGMADSESPWVLQPRASGDGNKDALFYSSLVKGEQKTGIYRSQPFALPAKLAFWCAGHIGPPGAKSLDLNYIRLRDAETNEVLAEARPPRNDTAQRIEWNLEKFAGKKGYVEIIDGDTGTGYAWLAVGRFSLDALNPNQTASRQQAVAKLAGELKLQSLRPQLVALLTNPATDSAARSGIGAALVALDPNARLAALARLLEEKNLDVELRNQIAQAIASNDLKTEAELFTAALKIVPGRVQTLVAEILSGDAAGAELLLKLIAGGKASPYLLRSPNIKQKLTALKRDDLSQQSEELTARLPPANELTDKLITEKRNDHQKGKWNLERGAEVFAKNCAACHQIGGKGAVVGPQLDGIGARGLERVLEDVIDPNRNVDVAFRMTTIVTEQGKIINGLIRREEGEQLVIVNSLGKEERINKKEIDERNPSTLSLMPELFQLRSVTGNSAETMPPEDFQNLLAYLLSQRAKPKGEGTP